MVVADPDRAARAADSASTGPTVWAINLHHHDTLVVEVASQADAKRPGPFNSNLDDWAERCEPDSQSVVAGPINRERLDPQHPT